jgi:hypothetical protein
LIGLPEQGVELLEIERNIRVWFGFIETVTALQIALIGDFNLYLRQVNRFIDNPDRSPKFSIGPNPAKALAVLKELLFPHAFWRAFLQSAKRLP